MPEPSINPPQFDCSATPVSAESGLDPMFLQSIALRYAAGDLAPSAHQRLEQVSYLTRSA